jgi:arylsulfatase A
MDFTKRSLFHVLLGCLATGLSARAAHVDVPVGKPNVVLILADDLGYGDLGCYNADSKIPTPNLDRLAAEGMRFTDAHSPSAVCSPTRYGLLTGRYAWRTEMKSRVLWAFDRPLIEPDRWTIARMMKGAGYHTACIGKWHLGWAWPTRGGTPLDLPFKIGQPGHAERVRLARVVDYSKPLGGGPLGAGFDFYFGDDVINQPPFLWIEDNRCLTRPTLPNHPNVLHGSSNGPCTPDWDQAKVLPRLTERAVDYLRKQGTGKVQPFLLYFPLTAPHLPIVPPGRFSGKSVYGPYGDFVHYVDWIVGRIATTLEETGAAPNTLLVFTSDNGSYAGNLKGHRPNGSLRGRKGQIFEGGHRVPLIIRWPGQVAAGSRNDQLVGLNDLPATFAAILKNPMDEGAAEDSVNLMPTLCDPEKAIRDSLVHHSVSGEFAFRSGKWKMIPSKKMLFDLATDSAEGKNQWNDQVKVVSELKQLMRKTIVAKAGKRETP